MHPIKTSSKIHDFFLLLVSFMVWITSPWCISCQMTWYPSTLPKTPILQSHCRGVSAVSFGREIFQTLKTGTSFLWTLSMEVLELLLTKIAIYQIYSKWPRLYNAVFQFQNSHTFQKRAHKVRVECDYTFF